VKAGMLRLIGAVVSSSIGARLLKWYALRTPHSHLCEPNGDVYMGRWRVVNEGTLGSRILHALTGYSSIRLHHIKRPDHDRDLHNHPFAYRTFIVEGFYAEHYEEPVYPPTIIVPGLERALQRGYRVVFRGDTATGNGDKFHRISDVGPQGVWTLFCMTANTTDWGFKVNGKLVNSVKYLLRKGYDHASIRDLAKDKEN
jgi:hypothetical protein